MFLLLYSFNNLFDLYWIRTVLLVILFWLLLLWVIILVWLLILRDNCLYWTLIMFRTLFTLVVWRLFRAMMFRFLRTIFRWNVRWTFWTVLFLFLLHLLLFWTKATILFSRTVLRRRFRWTLMDGWRFFVYRHWLTLVRAFTMFVFHSRLMICIRLRSIPIVTLLRSLPRSLTRALSRSLFRGLPRCLSGCLSRTLLWTLSWRLSRCLSWCLLGRLLRGLFRSWSIWARFTRGTCHNIVFFMFLPWSEIMFLSKRVLLFLLLEHFYLFSRDGCSVVRSSTKSK